MNVVLGMLLAKLRAAPDALGIRARLQVNYITHGE